MKRPTLMLFINLLFFSIITCVAWVEKFAQTITDTDGIFLITKPSNTIPCTLITKVFLMENLLFH